MVSLLMHASLELNEFMEYTVLLSDTKPMGTVSVFGACLVHWKVCSYLSACLSSFAVGIT